MMRVGAEAACAEMTRQSAHKRFVNDVVSLELRYSYDMPCIEAVGNKRSPVQHDRLKEIAATHVSLPVVMQYLWMISEGRGIVPSIILDVEYGDWSVGCHQ
jgi:hypothetical protein